MIKLTFYRIIQEQLNNILKYSKASIASVNLDHDDEGYRLVISDNGVGFNTNSELKGIGLRNIASRAELHSGHMEIISTQGNGCTIKVIIPAV